MPAMVYLMLHDDWEINGDGSGNPESLMFEPAKRLLDICDTHGAKYTFYAEIGQQINMLNAPAQRWRKHAATWEAILKDAIARGHDVQLHFHPQWIGAVLNHDKWKLDFSKWHSGFLPYGVLDEWIGKGKQYLEELLMPLQKNFEVVSYRAGGWMCQPSRELYRAFQNNKIVCDVSVMKGRFARYKNNGVVDFRGSASRYEPWEVDPDDFARAKKGSGVWELPVFTEVSTLPHPVMLLLKAFRPFYYYNIYRHRKIQQQKKAYSPKPIEKARAKEYYGSFGYMHRKHLMSYAGHICKMSRKNYNIKHLIFLTHSKSFLDYNNFEKLLKNLSSLDALKFITTRQYIAKHLIPK